MKQWQTKELAQLVQVSVRTLHHYDKIGLLKPSLRQSNNYRLYSEKDLLKLQQIIALKFFGFELTQIKELLTKQDVLENLALQSRFLQEKAQTLLEASTILERITSHCSDKKSISWEQVIELIEVYKMTQQLEDKWLKDIFTPEELKEYATFEAEFKSSTKQNEFEKSWLDLVSEFKANLSNDPTSEIGIALGKKMMDWVNTLYGKKYAHLRTKKFEQGFGEGKGLEEHGLTSDIVQWMDKAMDAYWRRRIYSLLDAVEHKPSDQLLNEWNVLMDEMYGDQVEKKAEIFVAVLQEDRVSAKAKAWLKATFNL